MRWLLAVSLTIGAISAAVDWAYFVAMKLHPNDFGLAVVAGEYALWSVAICTVAAFISAFAGWRVLSRRNSN